MVHGIGSLVQRRQTRQAVLGSLSHVVGGALGGAGSMALLWLLASPLRLAPPVVLVAAMAGCIGIAVASDLHLLRVPRSLRQVPQSWLARYGVSRSYLLYGIFLGSIGLTFAPYTVILGVAAATSLAQGLPMAVFTGMAFGLGRTLPVGVIGASRRAMSLLRITWETGSGLRRMVACGGAVVIAVSMSTEVVR